MLRSIQQRDLDRNRWIKITMGVILGLIIVSMVITLIPGLMNGTTGGDAPDAIASGNGQSAPVGTPLAQPLVALLLDATGQPVQDPRRRRVTAGAVEAHAGQRGHQLQLPETGGRGCRFASLQQRAAQPMACMCRIHEERTDLGAVTGRIEQRFVALSVGIATEQRAPAAPAAAADDYPVRGLRDVVGAVGHQRRIHTEGAEQGGFDLRRRIIRGSQRTNRAGDQVTQRGCVAGFSHTKGVLHSWR